MGNLNHARVQAIEAMDTDVVIFWFIVLSCASGLVVSITRLRLAALGWTVVYLAILLVAALGRLRNSSAAVDTALAMWFLFILAPALLSRSYYRCFLQQRYARAEQFARVISWLHPADGWRQQPQMIRALELARQGNIAAATDTFQRFADTKTAIGLSAVTNLFRVANRWEELLQWQKQHHPELEKHPELLPVLLRAHGETGDLRGMIGVFQRNEKRIARLVPVSVRDLCRLMLFAFCGRRTALERLMSGSLAIIPAWAKEFWFATAAQASGDLDSAKRQFESLLPAAEPSVRTSIERRLSRISTVPEQLDPTDAAVVDEAEREHRHDEQFGTARSLVSRHARATQLLIALNVLMFLVELRLGGTTNPETLYRLGALFPPAVRAGGSWRLVTSLFLHLGAAHLMMNMFALWVLGPFMEFALGSARYLAVYLFAGVGSMATVILFASGPRAEQITVGASGCIMGLVGATGALMLRGWMRHKASTAKRRLIAIGVIIAMQTTFDSLVPQVSMTAHLSGALIGFLAMLVFPDRLTAEARDQPTR